MEINTKYNHGDMVYVMYQNRAVNARVEAIGVNEFTNNVNYPLADHIYYNITVSLQNVQRYNETSIYPTKEALIQSL
jgi:hypothetical protein